MPTQASERVDVGTTYEVDEDKARQVCREHGPSAVLALMRLGKVDPDIAMDIVNDYQERPMARIWRVVRAMTGT